MIDSEVYNSKGGGGIKEGLIYKVFKTNGEECGGMDGEGGGIGRGVVGKRSYETLLNGRSSLISRTDSF